MDLENIEWTEFFLNDIFTEIQRGKRLKKSDHKKGIAPYISSTSLNNGIAGFISNKEKVRRFSNCLTIANSGSVGSTFYQPFEFVASDHVTKLKSDNLNKYIYQFISILCFRLGKKYSFNREINDRRIQREKILLPTTLKGEPDYAFMEKYMRAKEQDKTEQYHNYIKKRFEQPKDFKKVQSLDSKEWRAFYLNELFEYQKGDQNHMSSLTNGEVPLISAKKGENGLKGFVSKNNKRMHSKYILTINNDGDGGAGISYFQPFEFLLDSHVTALYPKKKLSRYSLLFLSRSITKQRSKFGHGYSLTNKRIKAFKLMLPINQKQEPDYAYMENYMKWIEYEKLKQYLKYKEILV